MKRLNTGQLIEKPVCPTCHKKLDGFASHLTDHRPSPGAVTICAYCREVLQFTDKMALRLADPEVIEQVMLDVSHMQGVLNEVN